MKSTNLRFIRPLIKLYLQKELKSLNNYDDKKIKILLNILIFLVILLGFKNFEKNGRKNSNDILKKPKIFWKLIVFNYKIIDESFYVALKFLNKFEKKNFDCQMIFNDWLKQKRKKKIENISNVNYEFYFSFLKYIYKTNDLLINFVHKYPEKVLDVVNYIDDLKDALQKDFLYSAHYIVYIYFLNLTDK